MAGRSTTATEAPYSDRVERRNLRRAGALANNSSTVIRVPGGSAAGPSPAGFPLSIVRDQPSSPRTRLSILCRATLAIDGNSSPRSPASLPALFPPPALCVLGCARSTMPLLQLDGVPLG